MEESGRERGFKVYLEGHEGHQGNVLLHAFLFKVHRLRLVLNKLERAYLDTDKRKTDFEIVNAEKRNPTSLTLKPVPRVERYDPTAAFEWSIHQISAVARGEEPDKRVRGEIAEDLVKLAEKESEYDYRAFWVNGYAEAVRFDDVFLANAMRLAAERRLAESKFTKWHTGISQGSVVGVLQKIDDLDHEREFVIVPPTGATKIVCSFPDDMRDEMGTFLFKMVKVTGKLHYDAKSPFPYMVEANPNGIKGYPEKPRRKSMLEMYGAFAGYQRPDVNWDDALNA